MKIVEKILSINSGKHCELIDITGKVQSAVKEAGLSAGDCIVYCPHTTAAITINENADPSVVHDMLLMLEELIPHRHSGYQHCEGNSDAHVKSSLFGCSQQVLIREGSLVLGTWQGIYFCEFDGPRSRKVILQLRGRR